MGLNQNWKVKIFQIFGTGLVKDPKPDPMFKPNHQGIYDYLQQKEGDSLIDAIPVIPIPAPNTEKVSKINPDVLVQFGHGIKYIGGISQHEINKKIEHRFKLETRNFA